MGIRWCIIRVIGELQFHNSRKRQGVLKRFDFVILILHVCLFIQPVLKERMVPSPIPACLTYPRPRSPTHPPYAPPREWMPWCLASFEHDCLRCSYVFLFCFFRFLQRPFFFFCHIKFLMELSFCWRLREKRICVFAFLNWPVLVVWDRLPSRMVSAWTMCIASRA